MMFRYGLGLALGTACLAMTQAPVLAQAPGKAWKVVCPKPEQGQKKTCSMFQQVVVAKTKQRLIQATVRRGNEKSEAVMELALPLGLYLPAGVAFNIDGTNPQRHQIQTCNKQGCFSGLPLSKDAVKALRKGKEMNVSFQALNRKNVGVKTSLKGFTAAYRKLR